MEAGGEKGQRELKGKVKVYFRERTEVWKESRETDEKEKCKQGMRCWKMMSLVHITLCKVFHSCKM